MSILPNVAHTIVIRDIKKALPISEISILEDMVRREWNVCIDVPEMPSELIIAVVKNILRQSGTEYDMVYNVNIYCPKTILPIIREGLLRG